jgi:ABC-type uncharacterized transport system substrate-binding protein
LQLLHELIPNSALFGVLADPAIPSAQSNITDLPAAARTLGLQLIVVSARTVIVVSGLPVHHYRAEDKSAGLTFTSSTTSTT